MTVRATLIVLALLPATASAAVVDSGTITVGQGVNGATLGMKRGQVIGALGTAVYENDNGLMSYRRLEDGGILDVYRDVSEDPQRVRLFVVSFLDDGAWELQDGNPIFTEGGIDRLFGLYGGRVRKRDERRTGSRYYYVNGRFEDRRVQTAFQVDRFGRKRARVLDVYIDYR